MMDDDVRPSAADRFRRATGAASAIVCTFLLLACLYGVVRGSWASDILHVRLRSDLALIVGVGGRYQACVIVRSSDPALLTAMIPAQEYWNYRRYQPLNSIEPDFSGGAGFASDRAGFAVVANHAGPPQAGVWVWGVVLAWWWSIPLTAAWPAAWLRRRRLARKRRMNAGGLCPHCGYDLRATPDRCPECGTAAPAGADRAAVAGRTT
jgi:hypothetical protein